MPKTSLIRHPKQWLAARAAQFLQSVYGGWQGGWYPYGVLESFAGAWQRNVVVAPPATLLAFSPVYACVTGIANDVSKMRIKLSANNDGIWEEVTANQPWLPLLRNPNHYQDRIKFIDSWMLSKLTYGNTYVLKERDSRGVVNQLYVLHPSCIRPLVAEDGSVYYELSEDDLSGLNYEALARIERTYGRFAIPASEVIHDRMNTLWHPLVGVPPLYACGTAATLGAAIQNNSAVFFQNKSLPGGMLTAPGNISDETAKRLSDTFQANFSGKNIGKLLVVGDGLEFKQFSIDAEKAQTKEQMEQAIDDVARAFRYPRWKLGGSMPPYTKPDQAQTQYYVDCLQSHVEAIELCLDQGLELPSYLGTEFDLDTLMRMDVEALYESNNKASGWMKVDEQRYRANLPPLPKGGDTVYKQHQDYSIEALAKRDAKADPFSTSATPPAAPAAPPPEPPPPQPKSIPLDVIAVLSEYRARTIAAA